MEVHQHGHVHEKKKWKEYVFQFFMLLLAVFLGSFAETKREEWVERHKEADYIESMIQDIRKDTAEIDSKYSFIFGQIQKIDTIQLLFIQNQKDYATVRKSYGLSRYLFWYAQAVFNERIFSQLIGSGNMRIIKKQAPQTK